MTATECLFCRIARGEIPATIVEQTADTVAFRDISPKAPTHVLIVPRRHIASVNDLEEADSGTVAKLVLMARDIAAAEGLRERGYRLVLNAGLDAGQSVDHIHLHLLGGRALGWPPG